MTTFARSLALAAALAVLAGGTITFAVAQDAKKAAKDKDDKKKDEKAEKPGTVEIFKGKDGFRFRIKNAEGKSLAASTKGHATKDEAIKVLEEIKAALETKPVDGRP